MFKFWDEPTPVHWHGEAAEPIETGMSMKLNAGTSGYSYKPWRGRFYPKNLPDQQMLRFYGERFRAVEINNSFYQMPTALTLRSWVKDVGVGFQFALKAPQQITHRRRLQN